MAQWISAGFFNAKTAEEALAKYFEGQAEASVRPEHLGKNGDVQEYQVLDRKYQVYQCSTPEGTSNRWLLFREMLEHVSVPYEASKKRGKQRVGGVEAGSSRADGAEAKPRVTGAEAKARREAAGAKPVLTQGLQEAGESGGFKILKRVDAS